ncbi:MAG: RdgB/HAM1 family non-canonical purine NTP pyrophosphatase [Coprothermobacterota bacterium]|nr:RdgB/HAM1 family non-canonical purine NTP pyrophosphatase [Coprothermobacterota bacterium]
MNSGRRVNLHDLTPTLRSTSDERISPRDRLSRLLCASANAHKLGEIRAILADLPLEILSLEDFPGLSLPPEDGSSYAENALLKARAAFLATAIPAFGDDTGLMVEALGGVPGLYSNRYAADDPARRRKLLLALAGLPSEERRAVFHCTIAFVWAGGEETFTGSIEGLITEFERGGGGFGYDPLFLIPAINRTYAEMSDTEKNHCSHRAAALRFFRSWLEGSGLLQTPPA